MHRNTNNETQRQNTNNTNNKNTTNKSTTTISIQTTHARIKMVATSSLFFRPKNTKAGSARQHPLTQPPLMRIMWEIQKQSLLSLVVLQSPGSKNDSCTNLTITVATISIGRYRMDDAEISAVCICCFLWFQLLQLGSRHFWEVAPIPELLHALSFQTLLSHLPSPST